MRQFDVITIFPEMLEALTRHGITRRALEEKLFDIATWDPRDFVEDNYRRVDDRPYGGGPGMVMLAEPLQACIDSAKARQRGAGVADPRVVLLSPQGERLTPALVAQAGARPHVGAAPGADRGTIALGRRSADAGRIPPRAAGGRGAAVTTNRVHPR